MRSVFLDCGWLRDPNAASIDQIARLHLAARRCGCELELTNVNPCLLELIDFAGLAEVLRVEVGGQAEEREQSRGVEEEGQLGDLPA
jgi:hypothetical protein